MNGGGGAGISKNPLILVMSEKKRHKCLILMLNLNVSKQTRSEAGFDYYQKSITRNNKLSKSE